MPTDPQKPQWIEAPPLAQLRERGPTASKLGGRQIALFVHEGQVLACNNRCPHEGYPLCEGALDAAGVLTCQWHNWKFDLRSGENLYGGDALRTYPVRMESGRVWVDVSEPPAAQRIAKVLVQLDAALDEHDVTRIPRELARLELAVGDTADAAALGVSHAIARSHDRLRYGMTHAYAGADAWLRLRDSLTDPAPRLACLSEALAHIGWDTLREAPYPYTTQQREWQPSAFLTAVEDQSEADAIAHVNGALAQGLVFDELEPTLARAALAHYNDFGHALIYLTHVRSLIERLGAQAAAPLLRAWVRALIFATREDLLPDFKTYRDALAQWPDTHRPTRAEAPEPNGFEALTIRQTLAATLAAAHEHEPSALWSALLQAGAHHLLRFDERLALRTDNAVGDDLGWLDFSHALTFGHAVRQVCTRTPSLWPQGLLQMALFAGRNSPHLHAGADTASARAQWQVSDPQEFDANAMPRIVDHGIAAPIFAVHRLKTWLAVRDTIALGTSAQCAAALRAAVNRFLSVQFKQHHALRTAQQALRFVERE
jgi:nitrite reductase/ring-hydroxylating ferredoxin subunit